MTKTKQNSILKFTLWDFLRTRCRTVSSVSLVHTAQFVVAWFQSQYNLQNWLSRLAQHKNCFAKFLFVYPSRLLCMRSKDGQDSMVTSLSGQEYRAPGLLFCREVWIHPERHRHCHYPHNHYYPPMIKKKSNMSIPASHCSSL